MFTGWRRRVSVIIGPALHSALRNRSAPAHAETFAAPLPSGLAIETDYKPSGVAVVVGSGLLSL